jgi:hypothetical protein
MTREDAVRLIENVFKAHWTNWRFDDEETAVWIKELCKYEYERAKTAINNFYMAQTKQGKPPPAQIRLVLRKYAQIEKQKQSNEPVKLFEIVREGKLRGYSFFKNLPLPADQEIEDYAEKVRKDCDATYGGKHYVVRYWMKDEVPF